MKITFLGTGHGRVEPERFYSSAIVSVGDKNYMIDGGAPVTTLCLRYGFPYDTIAGIFVTHSHFDHCIGLADLMNQIAKYPDVTLNAYFPDKAFYEPMQDFVNAVRKAKESTKPRGRMICSVYSDGEIFNDGNVRIIAVPTEHIANSHAFIIEAEGKRVCFTGDLKSDLRDYPKQIWEQDFDAVILEAAHNRLNNAETVSIIAKSRTRHLYINHYKASRNTPEMLDELRQGVGGRFPITVAYDGMELTI